MTLGLNVMWHDLWPLKDFVCTGFENAYNLPLNSVLRENTNIRYDLNITLALLGWDAKFMPGVFGTV